MKREFLENSHICEHCGVEKMPDSDNTKILDRIRKVGDKYIRVDDLHKDKAGTRHTIVEFDDRIRVALSIERYGRGVLVRCFEVEYRN